MRRVIWAGILLIWASLLLYAPETVSAQRRLVISIADRTLAVVEGHRIVREYPIAVGKAVTPTPTGSFQILEREQYPESQEASVFGTGWLEFFRRHAGRVLERYGIHGTNRPQSVGMAASHGCIRLHNSDMEDLFPLTYPGESVRITDEHLRQVIFESGG